MRYCTNLGKKPRTWRFRRPRHQQWCSGSAGRFGTRYSAESGRTCTRCTLCAHLLCKSGMFRRTQCIVCPQQRSRVCTCLCKPLAAPGQGTWLCTLCRSKREDGPEDMPCTAQQKQCEYTRAICSKRAEWYRFPDTRQLIRARNTHLVALWPRAF